MTVSFADTVLQLEPSRAVSPNDTMYNAVPDIDKYLAAGRSATQVIDTATLLGGVEPSTILDFGCGHGRILRWLQARWPEASLTAADVHRDQVSFCADSFGASPIQIESSFDKIRLPGNFDLIWLGSVFTHLDEQRWLSLLHLLVDSLSEHGLVVFSFAGATVYRLLATGDRFGVGTADEGSVQQAVADYESTGFGFFQQRESAGVPWGRSITSPSYVTDLAARLDLHVVLLTEAGYANRQDVICVRKGHLHRD